MGTLDHKSWLRVLWNRFVYMFLRSLSQSFSLLIGLLVLSSGCTPSPTDGLKFCSNSQAIKHYIEADGNPNLQVTLSSADSSEGLSVVSLLSCAAEYGDSRLVELLISKGANVNIRDRTSTKTPLHNVRSDEVAKFLIAKGAIVDAKTSDGVTPLFRARSYEIAELLINQGANVKATDARGQTPLHWIAGGQTINDEYKQIKLRVSQLLLSRGANANAQDTKGSTPLHEVVAPEIAELLIAYGGNIKARDHNRKTPLHQAVRYCRGGDTLTQVLIAAGFQVNAQDSQGKTPLHYFVTRPDCKESITALLNSGASVDLKDEVGVSPLEQATLDYEHLRGPYKGVMPEYEELIRLLKAAQNRQR
jgi:ankyrin repeat protein